MLKPGDRFGDYTVVRLLGQGGMGAVFLLENAEGGQIAAKILDPATAKDHEARKRFLREAQLALGVKHPNLVETYDVGEDPETGLCYILMEYVPGGDLAGRIEQEGALQISEATRIAYEIASVLELARQKGIVHRDIKPANIMFGADGKAKLADLGIARSGFGGAGMTTVTQTGMMIGTPAYMAPEQMLDAHNVDCRADIYSLGIVFYEMLTGERPNKDDTVVQLMAKALKGEPLPDVRTLRPEVSASLAQLLNMMVAPDKDGRISTPWQIMGALDIIARGGKFGVKTAVIADGRARTASVPQNDRSRKRKLVVKRGLTASVPQNGRSRKPFPWRVLIPIGLFAGLTAAFAILAPKRELVKSLVTTNVVERVVEKVAVRTSVVERVAGGIRKTARRNESVSPSVDRRAEAPGCALLSPTGSVSLAECGVCIDVSHGAIIVNREDFIAQFCGGEDAGFADFRRCPFGIDDRALASANLLLLFASSPKSTEYAPRELEAMDAFLRRGGSIVAFTCGCNVRLMESLFSRYGAHLKGISGVMSVRCCGEMSGAGPIFGLPMACVVPESGANGGAWQTLADSDTGSGGSVIGGRRVGRGRLFYVSQQMVGHSESGRLNAEWWRGFLPRCVDSRGMDAGMPDRRNAADMSDVGFNAGELEILAPSRFEHQAKALTELMVGLDDIKPTTDFRGFLLVDSATRSGGSVDGYSLLGAHFKGFPAHSDEMRREILKRISKMKGEGK